MLNLLFVIRNLADAAVIGASPACVATLPEGNLLKQTERQRTARSSSLAAQRFDLYWSAAQTLNCAGMTRTNYSTAAAIDIRGYDALSPSSQLLASLANPGFSTSGLDTDIDIYTEADFKALRSSMIYFPQTSGIRQLSWTVTDAANADGFIEQTRFWAGKYFRVTYDPPFSGALLSFMDLSKGSRADDGTHIVDKGGKYRKLSLNPQFIPDSDLPTMLAMSRYLGLDKECFVSVYPQSGGAKELYNMMACRLVSAPTFDPHFPGLHGTKYEFEET